MSLKQRLNGSLVAKLRDERGWTQVHLAREVDAHPSSVAKWENGHATPSLDKLVRLAAALGTSVESIVEREEKVAG